MNMKKGVVFGLTAAVAASAALSVSAVSLGYTAESIGFEVEAGQEVTVNMSFETENGPVQVTVDLPAGALEEGSYTFSASAVVDDDLEAAFIASLGDGVMVDYFEAYNFTFTDGNGNVVSPQGVVITIDTDAVVNNAYLEETDGSFTRLGEITKGAGGYQFGAPHCSRFVLANLSPIVPDDSSYPPETSGNEFQPETSSQPQPSSQSQPQPKPEDKGANTSDNSFASLAVLGVMGLAALGTALVATKSRKSSK